ncbi:MAG TPA: tripartite tricarboxylate transporter TctB family protein [Symbiobacteriaceae bacterium]|nr:tripartite tricarboxylate transporter TctB family protein [Symbiobacteriaceae bacterium]
MKKHERIAGLFLIMAGIATGIHSWWNLHLGSLRHPDSGFQPFLASVLLVAASTVWVLGSLGRDEDPQPFWAKGGLVRPALACLFILVYAWSMVPVGYVLSTLLFMLLWQFLLERERWLRAAVISLISTAAMWLIFAKLLAVPLPEGIFKL